MPESFTAPLELSYPYDRTLGPVLSRFLTSLRDGRIEATVGADGRRYVPPAEFDPVTGAACTQWVGAGPAGVVETWTWDPEARHAWALVRLDGADVPMLHRLLVDDVAAVETGLRVAVRWAANRVGSIDDIAGFVPVDNASDGLRRASDQARPDSPTQTELRPIERVRLPISMTYDWSAGPGSTSHLAALREGRLVGKRCAVCEQVYFPPRNGVCPRDGVLLGDDVELPPVGTITTFCIVNVRCSPATASTRRQASRRLRRASRCARPRRHIPE